MSGILVLILRILMAVALYAFLAWAIYTLWRDLKFRAQTLTMLQVPALVLTPLNAEEIEAVSFQKQEIFLGRDPSCTYPIQNETVSSRHARLSYHQNQWWIEDLNSKNGTYLNDEKLATLAVVIPGDEIRCGQATFRIDIHSSNPRS
jgi:pSer/pThr/pTyr-binding forkhead associated (FHA) protein